MSKLFFVGIDEVGRGPVAGPVTVCAVHWISKEDPTKILSGIKDSKKLTEKKREEWFKFAKENHKKYFYYSIYSTDSNHIDKFGIVPSIFNSSKKVLSQLEKENKINSIISDFNLPMPKKYNPKYIKKGDEIEPIISLASIIAKVERDKLMKNYAKQFPNYFLDKNKGYGTKDHIESIKKYGLTPIHRKTFLKNI